MKRLILALATLGPAGWAPLLPATVGSALVTAIAWFIPPPPLAVALALLVAGTLIAIWIAGEAEKELGHDAGPIVIDEAVGQSISLLFVPHTLIAFAASFVLFRIFDIWKPLGAREAQALPGGIGVVVDDVIAGLTACGAFHGGVWLMLRLRG
ncbi:MAG: phosphatidylglycerophosphatase A family protein [Candidatus Eiseniibacteriota bacterium]